MSDGGASLQAVDLVGPEDIAHQAQTLVHPTLAVVVHGHDASGLLAPVLQGVESEEGHLRRPLHPGDAHDPALLPGPVVEHGKGDIGGPAQAGRGGKTHSASAVRV